LLRQFFTEGGEKKEEKEKKVRAKKKNKLRSISSCDNSSLREWVWGGERKKK
jgi:hypothetical protein